MAFSLGGAVGRFLGGYLFDLAGSYNVALMGAGGALAVAVILINRLGPYAYPVHRPASPVLTVEPAVP
jgi:cyanate permease